MAVVGRDIVAMVGVACIGAMDVIRPPSNARWVRPDKISFATLVFNIAKLVGAVIGVVVAAYAFNEARRQANIADSCWRRAGRASRCMYSVRRKRPDSSWQTPVFRGRYRSLNSKLRADGTNCTGKPAMVVF